MRPARRSCCSIPLPRDSRGPRRLRRDHLCRRDERRRGRSSRRRDPELPSPTRPPVADACQRRSRPSAWSTTRPHPPAGPRRRVREQRRAGAIYRIRPDGFCDPLWETGDWPYDLLIEPEEACWSVPAPTARSSASPAIRHGRRSSPEPPPGRSPRSCANLRDAIVGATSNPGKLVALGADVAKRGTYESDVRDAGTTGKLGCHSMARGREAWPGPDLHAQRQHRHAGRNVERVVGALHQCRRRADEQPDRALSPVACGPQRRGGGSPSLTSVTAAYLPRNLRPEVISITVHPSGTVFQRPFSTGELEIAGYEDNTSDNRPLTQSLPAGRLRILRRPPGARAAHLPEGAADDRLEGGGRQRRPAAVRRACTGAKVRRRGRC